MPSGELLVEAPPELPKDAAVNPLARLMPLAGGVAALGMMVVYYTSGSAASRSPMFMAFPVMMLVSLLGTSAFAARGRGGDIDRDRRNYLRHVQTVAEKAANAARAQRYSTVWDHPDAQSLWALAGSGRMWERAPEDADFGVVRLGLGPHPPAATLVAPDRVSSSEPDPVTATAVRRLIRDYTAVCDLPVTLALTEQTAVTVAGDTDAARALLRAVICQLAMLHSPRHLKIATVVDPLSAPHWDWLKWLPQHRVCDDVGAACMTAYDADRAERMLDCVDGAHAIVLVDAAVALGPHRGNVTVLRVGPTADAAEEAGVRLVVDDNDLTVRRADGDETGVLPDGLTLGQASACARRLARFRPVAADDALRIDKSASWAQLMGIADPRLLDPAVSWRAADRGRRLRVPIGISEQGAPVELDIKEAAEGGMGPHGLCIGATGSGKSEFLRTLTVGMMATHSPDALNLVLIDFKGGATFLGLERARHVAAVITNLADTAHLVTRMKDALAGEMNRRQELLRAAGNVANIAEYHRVRAARTTMAPLPVLLVIVDEFSELLSQHPDFTEVFVAIGRLGRSLGMHLLLASQRLDEGRVRGLDSHLSYRICLKTFSTSESRSVIGVPDAYHLPATPGAAYLKTGAGEPVRFQTAFVSGPYTSTEPQVGDGAAAMSARLFTAMGTSVTTRVESPASRDAASRPSLLETVLDRLDGHGPPARQVWLPPLADSPTLDAVLAHSGVIADLTVPIGLVDRPFEQRRDVLAVHLAGQAGNVAVVGGPRSGKSTTLLTLITALAETHHPRDVQIYCLDFGGGALSSLRGVPHVGSVAGRDEVEVIRRTVSQVESILRRREIRRARGESTYVDDPYGRVFLVIDGWAAIRQEFAVLEAPITALAAHGLAYGIHVVVSASRWAEIRPALKDQIGTRIELRLGDPGESEMDRKRAKELISSPPGRGLTRDGHELTIALPTITGTAERLSARYAGCVAPPVQLLPTRIEHQAVVAMDSGPSASILLGIGEAGLEPVAIDFAAVGHLIVLGEARCGKTSTLRLLCRELVRTHSGEHAAVFVVDLRRTLLGVVESDHLAGYAPSGAALDSQLPTLLGTLAARMPGPQTSQQQLRSRSWWSGPEIYLIVDDYDLVAGAGVNPLAPLIEFLPHAGDLGLHVVIARRSGGAARAMFDPVLAQLRDLGSAGLMMSASPEEGVLLGSTRPSPLPPGRGTLVDRTRSDRLIQVAWSEPV